MLTLLIQSGSVANLDLGCIKQIVSRLPNLRSLSIEGFSQEIDLQVWRTHVNESITETKYAHHFVKPQVRLAFDE